MINQQLLDYISKQQEAGTADQIIKDNLLQAGWREEDIEEGFQTVADKRDGGNSTAAHQEMRKQAAEKRSGHDEYREDVKDEDMSDPQSSSNVSTVVSGLSPIDQNASKDSKNASRDNADKSETHSSSEPSGMEEISTESTESKPASESLNNITKKDTSQVDLDEVGPQAVRTFQSDSERAGVNVSRREQKPEINESKSNTAESKDAKDGAADREEEQRQEERRREKQGEQKQIEEERKRKEEKIKREREQRRREEEQRAREEAEAQSQQESQTEGGQGTVNSAADLKKTSRETDDGRRRFHAAETEQVSRRAARKKRQKEPSDSNFMSILVFIVALILVGGGAAWAYFTYFQTNIPEATASSVVSGLSTAKTFDFRLTVESAGSGGLEDSRLIMEGAVDLDPDTPAVSYYTLNQEGQLASSVQAVMAEVENIETVPQAQRQTIRDILSTPEFFAVGEFQTQERLGKTQGNEGFATNRFGISMSPRQLVSDYATLHQALFDEPLSGSVLESLQASVAGFSPTQGQIWIDPETGVPYQLTFIGTNAAGQDVQVNLQFRNHGDPIDFTPEYQPRSLEQSLSQYFSMVASGELENETDPTSTSTGMDSRDETANRFDRLRVNDIQQLAVALRIYANENNAFPSELKALTEGSDVILSSIPRDPETNTAYMYSVSTDGDRYHLGATLKVLKRSDLTDDANFNSRGQGFPGGFNGAASSCQGSTTGTSTTTTTTAAMSGTCYDIAGSTD